MKTIYLKRAMAQTFPEANLASMTLGSSLRDIRGWDSMTAVSFLMELEQAGGIELSAINLQPTLTLQELIHALSVAGLEAKLDLLSDE